MTGRLCLLAMAAAVAGVQQLAALPPSSYLGPAIVLTAILGVATGVSTWYGAAQRTQGLGGWQRLAWGVFSLMAAGIWAWAHAEVRVRDALAAGDEDKVSRVVLRIAELPQQGPDSRRFVAQVLSSKPEGIPSRIEVAWHGAEYAGPYGRRSATPVDFPELIPGQVWRMALNLRRPHGTLNPHGFDYEGHQFARGIRAMGSVRGTPVWLRDEPWANLSVVAQRARHHVRAAMQSHLQGLPYGGVLLALAIGDQASIPPEQWDVFNRSGLTHLVSISGSHITMIAVLGAWFMNALWRRLVWRGRRAAEYVPAQIAACLTALLVAWLYCLLAGWGVPARRTFLMLCVAAGAYLLRVPIGASRLICLTAALVVWLDPWALTTSGFWLSFAAVSVLLCHGGWVGQAVGGPATHWARRLWRKVGNAARLQWAISLALLPMLAMLFNQVSLVSPLANAYAIPVIGMVVTPLALLLALMALLPGGQGLAGIVAEVTHAILASMMPITKWLAYWPWGNFEVATAPWPWMLVAFMGLLIAVLPHGWPLRQAAWLLMLPALVWRPASLQQGDWRMVALDVGQGTAWVIQTATQTLVYDSGMRFSPQSDAAQRVLLPYLRSQGVRQLDVLVMSHADMDHVGGVRSLLMGLPVMQSYASFDLGAFVRRESRLLGEVDPPLPLAQSRCQQGQRWQIDGVQFGFAWPIGAQADQATNTRDRNASSCVLWVRGAHHAAWLPGDIGHAQESQLLALGQVFTADVVMAAHHGSRYSSALNWVQAIQATHVIAQAGRWNRYGHPHPDTIARWQRQNALFWQTDLHGAIRLQSSGRGLVVSAQREQHRRYWHGR